MSRTRSAAIIVHDGHALLMHRHNHGREYYAFIGGGVEPNETPEQAVVREVREETSLDVTVQQLVYVAHRNNGEVHYFYLCQYHGGEPVVQTETSEYAENAIGDNTHQPTWVEKSAIAGLTLYPEVIKQHFMHDWQRRAWPQALKTTTD